MCASYTVLNPRLLAIVERVRFVEARHPQISSAFNSFILILWLEYNLAFVWISLVEFAFQFKIYVQYFTSKHYFHPLSTHIHVAKLNPFLRVTSTQTYKLNIATYVTRSSDECLRIFHLQKESMVALCVCLLDFQLDNTWNKSTLQW